MKLLIQLKTLTCLVKIAEEHRESLEIVTQTHKLKKKRKKSELSPLTAGKETLSITLSLTSSRLCLLLMAILIEHLKVNGSSIDHTSQQGTEELLHGESSASCKPPHPACLINHTIA